MRRLLPILVTLVVLLFSPTEGWSQDFQKGVDAYNRGDYATAVKWYTLAAEQRDARAQFNLGRMYAKGEGVLQDYVYAHMWWNIAASNGDEYGAELRDDVEKEMTPSQIERAQDLARECVAKNYKGC